MKSSIGSLFYINSQLVFVNNSGSGEAAFQTVDKQKDLRRRRRRRRKKRRRKKWRWIYKERWKQQQQQQFLVAILLIIGFLGCPLFSLVPQIWSVLAELEHLILFLSEWKLCTSVCLSISSFTKLDAFIVFQVKSSNLQKAENINKNK